MKKMSLSLVLREIGRCKSSGQLLISPLIKTNSLEANSTIEAKAQEKCVSESSLSRAKDADDDRENSHDLGWKEKQLNKGWKQKHSNLLILIMHSI